MTAAQQGVIAHLVIDGAAEAIEFYKKALGATEVMRMPAEDGKRIMHAELSINGSRVFLVDYFPEFALQCSDGKVSAPRKLGGTGIVLHLEVPDCDAAVARMASAGAQVTMPPNDAFWGDRYAQVIDPYGHGWSFAHRLPAKS